MTRSNLVKPLHLLASSLLFVACVGATYSAESLYTFDAPVVQSKLPRVAKDPIKFVPRNWRLEQTVCGDLNADKLADCVLKVVLLDESGTDVDRALIVLFRRRDGSFRRVAASNAFSPVSGQSGMLGTTTGEHVSIEIAKGVLSVASMRGSRDAEKDILKFRFNRKTNKLDLIGSDTLYLDRGTGREKLYSANLITGRRLIQRKEYYKTVNLPVADSRAFKGPAVHATFETMKSCRLNDKQFGAPMVYDLSDEDNH